MHKKAIKKEEDLIKRISELEAMVTEHEKSEKSLRYALRKEFDNREKIIEDQTAGLIAANVQLRQENTERNRAEDELRYRVEFEKLITTLSTNFIKLSPDKIDAEINTALQTIGKFVGVDRSYVFLFSDNAKRIDDIYEWCAKGIKPQIQNLKGRSIDDEFPWFAAKIKRHGVFHVSSCDNLPTEANAEKKYLRFHKIQSLIDVPMFCGRSFIGFVGFDSVRMKKTWEVDIIALLRIVGEIFANALERKWMDMAIRENEKKYQLLFEYASDGIAVLDMDGNILDCNKAYTKLIGCSRKDIVGKSVTTFLASEYKRIFQHRFPLIKKNGRAESELELIQKDGKTIPIWCKATAIYDEYGNIKSALTHCRDITKKQRNKKTLKKEHFLMGRETVTEDLNKILNKQHKEILKMETALLNTINDSALLVDKEGIILALNEKVAKGFGKKIKELLGQSFYNFFSTDPAIAIKAKIDGVIRSAKQTDFYKECEGEQMKINCSPILDEQGKVIKVVILFRKIERFKKKRMYLIVY